MNARPKVKLKLNRVDKILEITGWGALLIIWTLTVWSYPHLPDTIPIHYNLEGIADGFGNKAHIMTLPIIATVLFTALTMLNKFPHIFNYPTPITAENAFSQYTIATRLIRVLKCIIVIIFGVIAFKTIHSPV